MTDDYNVPDFVAPGHLAGAAAYERADFQPSLRVGMEAPDFDLPEIEGGRVRLSEVARERHVVLVFGAITSPVTCTHLPELNRMWEYYRWRAVQFLFVYARESHPGETYPHHTHIEQKMAAARDLKRIEEVRFPVLVDSLDGATHRAYGPRPNPSFVVNRDRRLVYRTPAVDPPTLREYLEHLLLWDEVKERNIAGLFYGKPMNTHLVYTEQLRFQLPDGPLHEEVCERAGPKAVREMDESLEQRLRLSNERIRAD